MYLTVVTASTGPCVSLDEAKDHLYINGDGQDADVGRKLREATDYCERRPVMKRRKFMSATYDGRLPAFPAGAFTLPVPPLQSVTWIKYYNGSNVLTTLGSTGYSVLTEAEDPGNVGPAYGQTWPSAAARDDAVSVRFVAGWPSAADVPDSIKAAVKLKLADLFGNRGDRVHRSWDRPGLDKAIDDLLGGLAYADYR